MSDDTPRLDPTTGMVRQRYTVVDLPDYRAFLGEYPRLLRRSTATEDDTLGLREGHVDNTLGDWPQGLVAFQAGSGRYYIAADL